MSRTHKITFEDYEGEEKTLRFEKLDEAAVRAVLSEALSSGIDSLTTHFEAFYGENFTVDEDEQAIRVVDEIITRYQSGGQEAVLAYAVERQKETVDEAADWACDQESAIIDIGGIREVFETAGLDNDDFDDIIRNICMTDGNVQAVSDVSEIFGRNTRVLVSYLIGGQPNSTPYDDVIEADGRSWDVFPIIPNERLATFFGALNVDKDEFLVWLKDEMGYDPTVASDADIGRRSREEQAKGWREMVTPPTRKDEPQIVSNETLFHILQNASYGGVPAFVIQPKAGDFVKALAAGKAIRVEPTEGNRLCGQVGIHDFQNSGHLESAREPYVLDLSMGSFHTSEAVAREIDDIGYVSSVAIWVDVSSVEPKPDVEHTPDIDKPTSVRAPAP